MSEVQEGPNLDPVLLDVLVGHLSDEIEDVFAEIAYETSLRKRWFSSKIRMQINLALWA